MKSAVVFPGQGSQFIGMGKALYDYSSTAKAIFELANDSLSFDITSVCFEGGVKGNDNLINLTEYTQPALLTVSMAVLAVLEKECNLSLKNTASFLLGHSLGEYTALTAGGVIDFTSALKIVHTRGKAMQQATPLGYGKMIAVLGLSTQTIQDHLKSFLNNHTVTALVIANDNSDGQQVLSGDSQAIDLFTEFLKDKGAKKVVALPVSAPFHSPLMKPAAEIIANQLNGITLKAPTVPIIMNITAQPETDPQVIKNNIIQQTYSSVRWRESVLTAMEQGVNRYLEIGAGSVLSGLNRRIHKDAVTVTLETPESINQFLQQP